MSQQMSHEGTQGQVNGNLRLCTEMQKESPFPGGSVAQP